MPYRLIFTERYTRIAARFLKRHPDLARPYEKTLTLLQANPHHPSLRLHELGGRLRGVHSVSINLSYRITLHLLVTEHEIVPLDVGGHDDVY
ncbi:MAG: hypothetical protein JHC40_14950 [Burkholderiales bacterium]|jgi:mRNA-degrading endonuclease YafQ of YafQ-DinJ toxin-antitoxin module|nr:hypothetical protein [Burkholderiales bacterium]